jgi:hypothetical protein
VRKIVNTSFWQTVGIGKRWRRADGRYEIIRWDDRKTFAVMQRGSDGYATQCLPTAFRSFGRAMAAADKLP